MISLKEFLTGFSDDEFFFVKNGSTFQEFKTNLAKKLEIELNDDTKISLKKFCGTDDFVIKNENNEKFIPHFSLCVMMNDYDEILSKVMPYDVVYVVKVNEQTCGVLGVLMFEELL